MSTLVDGTGTGTGASVGAGTEGEAVVAGTPSRSGVGTTTGTTTTQARGKRGADGMKEVREVIYPDPEPSWEIGENALGVQRARDLLGWAEEEEKGQFGQDYLLVDRNGKKVRCKNNVTNRPLYMTGEKSVDSLMQEILNKRWRFNGEAAIIGKTGLVLNGQHTLIALVLSEQERTGPKKDDWKGLWSGPISIDKLIVFGIDEDDRVVNTMDTCKPRSLADVVYRSEYFAKFKREDRKTVAKITDGAIKLLWLRTGASKDPFTPRRTHSEALDFISRHEKLLKAVKHIHEENRVDKGSKSGKGVKGGKKAGKTQDTEQHHIDRISDFISPGFATGLLYLMAASASDGEAYHDVSTPSEKKIKWDNWDRACEFWTLFAKAQAFMPVRRALAGINTKAGGTGRLSDKIAVIAKAWEPFKQGYNPTEASVTLSYYTDDQGQRFLTEAPSFGGIDIGGKVSRIAEEPEPEADNEVEVTGSEPIETETGEIRTADTLEPPADPSPEELETLKAQEGPHTRSEPAPAKRGPGRPRKVPVPAIVEAEAAGNEEYGEPGPEH